MLFIKYISDKYANSDALEAKVNLHLKKMGALP